VSAAAVAEGNPPLRKERPEPPKPTRFSPRKRRGSEDLSYGEESPRKKTSLEGDRDRGESPPIQKVIPRRASTFKGATLVSNPNPLRFALRAWANPVLRDESSSSEDEKGPETPEDHLSPPAATIIDLERDQDFPMSAPALPRAPLTFKPSPFTFAKRRWASASVSPGLGTSLTLEDDHREKDREGLSRKPPPPDRTIRRVHSMHAPGRVIAGDEVHSELTSTPLSPASDNFSYPSNASSEDEAAMELVHVYPVASKSHHMHKPMQFCSHAYTSSTKPTFIHAGWDDACSDVSDT